MRTDWRRTLWWFTGATALFPALVAAFRMELGEDREEPLAIADVARVWQGSDGGRLTVRADGTADLERVTRPGPDCGQSTDAPARSYTGPATWVFDTYPDERPGIRLDSHRADQPPLLVQCPHVPVVDPAEDHRGRPLPRRHGGRAH
ncbi:hypothetical protein [Streptomyces yangpuensis]|uniref:hypothetical protein n=1 Tax=Streptomyces yangpuensis TaxID=1648182 RepID=UPI000AADB219|nr:hypothetical protein [Streptomyces yangpuensis]